jgi:rod shape-determining protein MreD
MSVILSIPVLAFISILQSAVVSRLPLNQGVADLMLVLLVAISLQKRVTTAWQWSIIGGLLIDSISGLPFGIFTASYLLATGLGLLLRERIWRYTFLMQLLVVLVGTLISQGLSYLVLFLRGAGVDFLTVLQMITMPSIILNFMLSLPIFILTKDVLDQISPQEQNA